jgi:hypothetical protein
MTTLSWRCDLSWTELISSMVLTIWKWVDLRHDQEFNATCKLPPP